MVAYSPSLFNDEHLLKSMFVINFQHGKTLELFASSLALKPTTRKGGGSNSFIAFNKRKTLERERQTLIR